MKKKKVVRDDGCEWTIFPFFSFFLSFRDAEECRLDDFFVLVFFFFANNDFPYLGTERRADGRSGVCLSSRKGELDVSGNWNVMGKNKRGEKERERKKNVVSKKKRQNIVERKKGISSVPPGTFKRVSSLLDPR